MLTDTVIMPPIPLRETPNPHPTRLTSIKHDAEIKNVLSYLDADMAYDDWLKVGMALHAGGFPVDLWDEWSKESEKYEPGVCASKWASFSAGNGITIRSLVHMARKAGWSGALEMASIAPTTFIDPITLQGKPIPERHWVVPDWIPWHCTTALYGDGGTGKSLLAMQLMTAAAIGGDWLGKKVSPLKVLGFFCEDTADELHRRQEKINRFYGCSYSDLRNMIWYSGVGEDNTLVEYDSGRRPNLTTLFEELENKALKFGAGLIVIDTAADTFGGNENARGEVRNFIGRLNHIALQINGAVLLCAHPSAAGMATGRGDGGSTGWNNSVRSRLSLERPQAENGEDNTDMRILSRKKANYARTNEDLKLWWQDGAFVTGGNLMLDAVIEQKKRNAEECFLKALADFKSQGRHLSSSKNSGNFAPKMMMQSPHCQGFTRPGLMAAMESLFIKGVIQNVPYGRGKNPSSEIVKVGDKK